MIDRHHEHRKLKFLSDTSIKDKPTTKGQQSSKALINNKKIVESVSEMIHVAH